MYRSHHIGTDGIGRGRCSGNSEIRHLYFSVFGNNDILWLNIPVDNMMAVSSLHSSRHLDGNADGLFGRKSAFLFYIIFQSDAFHQFHNHKIQSAILSHVVYIYHIGIHQTGRCSGLTDKLGDKHSICPVITL